MMATALAALVMLPGCGSAPAASSEVETYSSAMQLVTLTDDEMLASIQEAAKELQKNINKTDETAKVDVEVDKDGKCIVYASGRDENGNATTRQELCKADTIKDMFEFSMTMIGLTATAMSTSIPLADAVVRRLIP